MSLDGAWTRRRVLAGGVALASAGLARRARADLAPLTLMAEAIATDLAGPDGSKRPGWGFNGQVGGLALTVPKGAAHPLRLTNALPADLALDTCGLRLGKSALETALAPGQSRDTTITIADPGFALALSRDPKGRAMGLAGAIIVPESAPPAVDADLLAIVQDWPGADPASPPTLSVAGAPDVRDQAFLKLRRSRRCSARSAVSDRATSPTSSTTPSRTLRTPLAPGAEITRP